MAKYCTHCGSPIDEEAIVCIHCGHSVGDIKKSADSDSVGWGILGFLLPLVGFILWLVWKDEYPKKAKSVGIGALVSVILGAVAVGGYYLFFFIAIAAASVDASSIFSALNLGCLLG